VPIASDQTAIMDQGFDVATGHAYSDETACNDAYMAFLNAHPEYRGDVAASYTAFANANPPCAWWAQYQARLLQPVPQPSTSVTSTSSDAAPLWAWILGGVMVVSAGVVAVVAVVTRPGRSRVSRR